MYPRHIIGFRKNMWLFHLASVQNNSGLSGIIIRNVFLYII